MKKFLFKLSAFILALVLPFLAYFAYMQSLGPVSTSSLMGISSKKLDLVSDISGEKIVVVGGSNVVYNISAQQLSDAFDMPVFNMGTTAYLGLDFFITQLKNYASSGDIIILSLESSMYLHAIDYRTVWMAVENHQNMQSVIPTPYIPHLILNYSHYAQTKTEILQRGEPLLSKDEGYSKAGFDTFGDYTLPYPENILDDMFNTHDTMYIHTGILSNDVLTQLNDLHIWAQNSDIQLFLTYAPFNKLALLPADDPQLAMQNVYSFEEHITQSCTIPWIGSYSEAIMDAELFYDSNNHLNSNGRNIRTADLISDLQKAL